MPRPLALTLGEAAGIGPDITLAIWRRRAELAVPAFYLLADPDFIAARAARLKLDIPLATVSPHEAFAAFATALREIVAGPLMQRYSKALEYEYSPTLRKELISQEVRYHGRAIEAAVAMLHASAKHSLLLARALDRSRGP